MRLELVLLLSLFVTPCVTRARTNSPPGLPDVLPRDLEVELALSAAPEHLRREATVYVLAREGYEKARPGSNGWTCFVGRGPEALRNLISPMCHNKEGMATMGRATFDRAALRRQGLAEEEVAARMNASFASGTYLAPRRAGVIYMLSPVVLVPDTSKGGRLRTYVPHLMFYAPNITNDDIGVSVEDHVRDGDYLLSGLPYLPVTGPHGFIVVPLGEKERARYVAEHHRLIERMRHYVELDVRVD